MSRKMKDLLKEIASFGEKQFHETGAAAVEVLRVKSSTIRKHFRKLRGIAYLVSVISLDRVRIYFFNTTGIMLLAENIDPALYTKIRKTSKLIIKFEKPIPPTKEELRIEATEELRSNFSKAIRRVSRMLGQKEPKFPDIFVSRETLNANTQGFGLHLSEDGTMIFEEPSIESNYAEGLNLRAATLLLIDIEHAQLPFSQCLGNALAYSLLKEPMKAAWLKAWSVNTSEDLLTRTLIHFVKHETTYLDQGYHRFITLLQETPPIIQLEKWIDGLEVIHRSLEVPLGTEDYQLIKRFCTVLEKPRKLKSFFSMLNRIHLSPRVICDPTSIGTTLSLTEEDYSSNSNGWFSIQYIEGSKRKSLILSEDGATRISSIEYNLNIEDLIPKPAGIVAHGIDFIRWAKQKMNFHANPKITFEARIEFDNSDLAPDEKAVLERMTEGTPDIIQNSLVGSPQRIDSLVRKGKIIFLPSFQHLGLSPNFLVIGEYDSVSSGVKEYSLESTTLNTTGSAYAIVCAPVYWAHKMAEYTFEKGLQIFPIVDIHSTRNVIRYEETLPTDLELELWLDSNQ